MSNPDPLRSILILGGGVAGWMAALYLRTFLNRDPCHITVVEGAAAHAGGVGEATGPLLVGLLRNLRLDEAALMRAAYATYRLGTRFGDWQGPGHAYWHPYGICGGTIDGVDLFHPWLRAHREGQDLGDYADYSLQVQAAMALKAPRPLSGHSPITETAAYGFHLDTTALAAHFRELAIARGVAHLFDAVESVEPDGQGAIGALHTRGDRHLTADLFLDCTGSEGRLIAQALDDPWIDWSDLLPCDRMVVTPLPRDPGFPPYTRIDTGTAGWRWRLPLSHRAATGYVYSGRHQGDAEAAAELEATLSPPERLGAVPRVLPLPAGRRTAFWSHNCVAIGTAAGSLEPLESTGLYFTQLAIEALMEYFPDRAFDPVLARDYNTLMGHACQETRDFILLHYHLAGRDDTPFWREARAAPLPAALAEAMERYAATGQVHPNGSPFGPASHHFVYAGNGRLPRRPSPQVNRIDPAETLLILDRIRERNRALVETLPTHRALIAAIHEQSWF